MTGRQKRGAASFSAAALVFLLVLAVFYGSAPLRTPGAAVAAAGTLPEDFAPRSDSLQVHVLDVGQADAILAVQGDAAMLVDTGTADYAGLITGYIAGLGVDTLQYLVLTHPHADHIGSAPEVLERFAVENILMPDVEYSTQIYARTLDAAAASGAAVLLPVPGDVRALGDAEFTVLSPIPGRVYGDLNDYSVALRLVYQGRSVLLTGDMGLAAENEILAAGWDIDSDVLKAGHHGSKTASGPAFLAAVSPAVILLTVAAGSPDNLPNPQVLARFAESGADIYRSDVHGLIVLDIADSLLRIYYRGGRGE